MTYNVLGFNYHEPALGSKPSESIKLILDADPDVVLMQEGSPSGLEWDEIPSLKPYQQQIAEKYPYRYQSNEGLNILSKFPFTTVPLGEASQGRSPMGFNRDMTSHIARAYDLQLPNDKQLRLVDFRLQSYHLSFGKNMSVRVSPDVKPSALERMRRSFALRDDNAKMLRSELDHSPDNVIVCGDMNDIPASHVYRVISGGDLQDAWCKVGLGYGYTYNRFGLRYRIDHVLYRGDVRALRAQRIKGGSSDHYPVMVTFDIDVKNEDAEQN
jgi:endonuclease/exonuclease/phosphatase (EEP) superfamily protein YafD